MSKFVLFLLGTKRDGAFEITVDNKVIDLDHDSDSYHSSNPDQIPV